MKIRELFDKPEKWTKGENARNSKGKPCRVNDEKAYSFCLVGAIEKCYGSDILRVEISKLISHELYKKKLADNLIRISLYDKYNIFYYNDLPTTTFENIKNLVEELDI